MTIQLTVKKGPLSGPELDAVAASCGAADPHLRALPFCEEMFNGNPFGFSWHGFVHVDGRMAGHYAVVPYRARNGTETLTSGKGEGLFLREDAKTALVPWGSRDIPAGMALMSVVHGRALEDGASLLHNRPGPEAGSIQKLGGFREVRLTLDQFHFLLAPGRPMRALRVAAAGLVSAMQRVRVGIISTCAAIGGSLAGIPAVEIEAGDLGDRALDALEKEGAGTSGWSVARDRETLQWLQRLGRLLIVSVSGRKEQFAILSRGEARELIHWAVPDGDNAAGLALLCALLRASIRDGVSVVSVPRRLMEGSGSLRWAMRSLGFFGRRVEQVTYVKAASGIGFPRVAECDHRFFAL